ncbi:potassium transporter Kup [Rhodopila globiformis]|uniref:Probable potassium transport system protein Kup n=1 Tax=Rhodopila globiformis TaxID=1071 RepID=A0A2S6MYD7_RHOGL|nr:potassium transporter Kup [Rhodopila globiformis]
MDRPAAPGPTQAPPQTSPADRPVTVAGGLAALGIVYGDLGTSPLYTYQTIVGSVGGRPSAADALGLLSLVVWALIITVSIKYSIFVMRADNHGEGGILALMALVSRSAGRAAVVLVPAGLFGAALIYGDGIITPAISVLSALEGVSVATGALKPYVLPAALVVLLLLFSGQVRGTASIGRVFGPVMLLWFVVIGALGLLSVLRHPEVARALDPRLAIQVMVAHGWHSFIVLGGVFLAITGGEALYADMGHIGRKPIRASWYGIVLPALLLCYAGQTALLLADPGLQGNPFFRLAPVWAVVPLVVLATGATIIASQAIITGVFSLTRQAMQLGWFPGLNIRQTSDQEYGQIYVPVVNWTMMVCTLALAFTFGSSERLAGAYGTAVSTTMLLTTALLFNAMRDVWRWPAPLALLLSGVFLAIDLAFFGANLLKLREGGWIPLLFGGLLFLVMTTWRRGMEAVHRSPVNQPESAAAFLADLKTGRIARVPGTAVFLSRSDNVVPPVLVRHVAQIKALQEIVVTLTVRFEEYPRVPLSQRAEIKRLGDDFWHVTVRFGFVEIPNLAAALACAREQGCPLKLDDAVYFAAQDEVVRKADRPRLPGWRRMLFAVMYRNAVRAPDRFDLPAERFLEVGQQIAL